MSQRVWRLEPERSFTHSGPHCARPACSNPLPPRSGRGAPTTYCSPRCQTAVKSEYATSVRTLNASLNATLEFHRGLPPEFTDRVLQVVAGNELHKARWVVDKDPQSVLLADALKDLLHALGGRS